LYVGGNPNLGLQADTYLRLNLDGLFDPGGLQINVLPVQIDFFQPSLHRTFQAQATVGLDGRVQLPPIDLGPILVQPYSLLIGVPSVPQPPSFSRGAQPAAAQAVPGYFKLRSVTVTSSPFGTTGVGGGATVLSGVELAAPIPNPTAGNARVSFSIDARADVRVDVLDLAGRQVRTLLSATLDAGEHTVTWDGRADDGVRLANGCYFLKLASGGVARSRKIVLMH
jgi:hypothetical protein